MEQIATLVSVVVPCHDEERGIGECLASVLRSSYSPLEVVCVDDGSTDGTARVAGSFQGVTVVRLAERSGPAAARNLGAERARGEALVFVDADVSVREDTVERLVGDLERGLGDAVQALYSAEPLPRGLAAAYKAVYLAHAWGTMPEAIPVLDSCCVAVRRETFLAVGGYDAGARAPATEDWDLGQRIASAGGRLRLDKGITIVHRKALSFAGLLRNDLWKAFDASKLFIRSRGRRASLWCPGHVGALPHPVLASAALLALAPPAVALAARSGGAQAAAPAIAAIAALYIAVNAPLARELWRAGGARLALASAVVHPCDVACMGLGGALGALDYALLGRRY